MRFEIIAGAILWIIIIFGISQCEAASFFYVKVGVGKNSSPTYSATEWIDHDEIGGRFAIGHRHQFSEHFYGDLNWSHISQYNVGYPWDDIDESASEHWYYDIEYRF